MRRSKEAEQYERPGLLHSFGHLGDIVGAADLSDFVMEVQNVTPSSPLLLRGAVVCRKGDGTMTLAGAEGTGPDDVFGIVLDPGIDPSPGTATASVGRSGVYDATQLLVDSSVTLADFADGLRERGIFLEKLEMVGVIAVPTMPTVAPPQEQPTKKVKAQNPKE